MRRRSRTCWTRTLESSTWQRCGIAVPGARPPARPRALQQTAPADSVAAVFDFDSQVLTLLPGHWNLSLLDRFLPQAIRSRHHTHYQGRIVRNLYRSQMVQLKAELAVLRAPAAVIQENSYAIRARDRAHKGEGGERLMRLWWRAWDARDAGSARCADGTLTTPSLRATRTASSCT